MQEMISRGNARSEIRSFSIKHILLLETVHVKQNQQNTDKVLGMALCS